MASTDYHLDASDIIPFTWQETVSIGTDSDAISSAVDLSYMTVVGLETPSDWTNATITFQASFDNSTFADMYDKSGSEYEVTVTDTDGAEYIPLPPADFSGIKYLKVRSGTAATPVAQGSARTLKLVTRRVA